MSNINIGRRLGLGLACVIGTMSVVVAITWVNLSRLSQADRWNTHTYQVLDQSHGLLLGMLNIETGLRGFVAGGKESFLEPYAAGRTSFIESMKTIKELTSDNPQQQQRLQAIQAKHEEFLQVADQLVALRRAVDAKTKTVDELLAAFSAGRDKAAMDGFRALNKELADAEGTLLTQRSATADALRSWTQGLMLGGAVIATLLSVAIGYALSRSIVKPLNEAVRLARSVAGGDLTVRIEPTGKSETTQLLSALKDMQTSLLGVVTQVRTNCESVATASSQIAQGNNDLSSRTEQQASALQQTAASMEELGSTVRQNADNAKQANQLAVGASSVAAQGGEVVSRVVETMKGINDSSKKIADIISVIDGIAFQTNILALNAAVEAARAGEQGRGFAVVASEVRSLAQRSAQAAKEIKQLITASVDQVGLGTALVDQAGSTMTEVVASIRRVTDIMAEISAASVEQSSGVTQVGEAVTEMDRATQQNAALVEESAAAAESLREQAQRLVSAVAVFKLAA